MCESTMYTDSSVRCFLSANADPTYAAFHGKLLPQHGKIYGVRTPLLKQYARKVAATDWRGFLQHTHPESYDESTLRGFVIAYAKAPYADIAPEIVTFVTTIDNWATCDLFCGSLKIIRKNRAAFRSIVTDYLQSDREFEVRFAVVILMQYYLDESETSWVLDQLKLTRHPGYYVKMSIAWAVSAAWIKQREATLKLLSENTLDPWTQNKAIQKCRESFRVSPQDKQFLLSLKR